jgi:uncharacterized protein YlxP (DUF503 family)
MVVGILQFELRIHDPESIKDKRRVVKSLKDRLHREHLVSVAEVDALDDMRRAVLGLACVGQDGLRVGQVLDRISDKVRDMHDAELVSMVREMLHGRTGELGGDGDDSELMEEEERDDRELAAELIRRAAEDSGEA